MRGPPRTYTHAPASLTSFRLQTRIGRPYNQSDTALQRSATNHQTPRVVQSHTPIEGDVAWMWGLGLGGGWDRVKCRCLVPKKPEKQIQWPYHSTDAGSQVKHTTLNLTSATEKSKHRTDETDRHVDHSTIKLILLIPRHNLQYENRFSTKNRPSSCLNVNKQ